MHFTWLNCTVTSWDQVPFREVTPQKENKTSVDSPKDHLHVRFPQCLPGENRRIRNLGCTTMSTGKENQPSFFFYRLDFSGSNVSLFLRPGVVPDSCGVRGWDTQAFFPVHTCLYLWAKCCTITWVAQIMCLGDTKSVRLAHLTELQKTEILSGILKEVGNERKLLRICPTFILNLPFFAWALP